MAGNAGTNKLARVLFDRMKRTNKNQDQLELGTIKDDMSLLTDHFPIPIPKGEYLIARQLTLGDTGGNLTVSATDGSHDVYSDPYPDPVYSHVGIGVDHKHDILIPEKMRWLKPGDRVLVAWVNQGTDPVIIDIVIPS
ncbi:hypothetical protein [Petroclostridium sp. X23]|uniref:hypothetical protein n=1 Tax=Petroclostridium sp. X23 TaxID=3045146 RepID=UPI0024AD2F0B|nr:hypothetical protein [Petroclostridium sp. X23]WHH58316.1 hypothetical protein QKW49_21330 [Petroclostridium sp. X23]